MKILYIISLVIMLVSQNLLFASDILLKINISSLSDKNEKELMKKGMKRSFEKALKVSTDSNYSVILEGANYQYKVFLDVEIYGDEVNLILTGYNSNDLVIFNSDNIINRLKFMSESQKDFLQFLNNMFNREKDSHNTIEIQNKIPLNFIFNDYMDNSKILIFNLYLENDIGDVQYYSLYPLFFSRMIYWSKFRGGSGLVDADIYGAMEVAMLDKSYFEQKTNMILENIIADNDSRYLIVCYDVVSKREYSDMINRELFYKNVVVNEKMLPDAFLRYKVMVDLRKFGEKSIVFFEKKKKIGGAKAVVR